MPILTPDDGLVAKTPEEQEVLQGAGYQQCYGKLRDPLNNNRVTAPCDFHISPESQANIVNKGGYFTCPRCQQSHDLLYDLPWHGADENDQDSFSAGGGTRIGLKPAEQGQIGEDLVEGLKEIPGYGPITWVHPGGANSQSPLDMATKDWGIEVKTLGYDATHHRFIPGDTKEKSNKDQMALGRGLKGILGLLVILNYRTSMADIYAREFPTEKGVGTFRTLNAQHLIAEIPFKNPFMDPANPSPTLVKQAQEEPMPF